MILVIEVKSGLEYRQKAITCVSTILSILMILKPVKIKLLQKKIEVSTY